jgi:hypothetical protein
MLVSLSVASSTVIFKLQALFNCLPASFLIFSPPELYVWVMLFLGCEMKSVRLSQFVKRMLFSLVPTFDRFNRQIEYLMNTSEPFINMQRFRPMNCPLWCQIIISTSMSWYLFLLQYLITYTAIYLPDGDIWLWRRGFRDKKKFKLIIGWEMFGISMNHFSPAMVVRDMGVYGEVLWQFQSSLDCHNINSCCIDDKLRGKMGMILLSSLMSNSVFDIEGTQLFHS